ncbi:Putative rhamnosyl transferase [Paracoccus alkenifer]|uniref:Putative rhamnosyl transferase n=1 Tax=Paracoccus alkenifer TaxID=65735 RepID=A0A1H6MUS4_9RHOB|nr:Putative rhamnosyl transferase [Paracoccus alkenifer]
MNVVDPVIFGYMRFSYLGRSDVILARTAEDQAERRRILYAPERMEQRFHLFERLCAPSLRWQTDRDFRLAILTSPELPLPYRERLHAITADIPQVEIICDDAPHITQAIDPWIARQPIVHQTRTLHFRLDDDDALASDFVATLRDNMGRVPDRGIISRPAGLFLADTPDGPELLAKFEPFIAIGFALVNPPGRIHNPYGLRHAIHHRWAPALILPQEFAYIHAAHLHADTLAMQRTKLGSARAEHARYHAGRPRRFRQAVKRQFGGHNPEHFLRIIATSPARRGQAETQDAPT